MAGFSVRAGGGVAGIADAGRSNPVTGARPYDLKGAADRPAFWAFVWFGLAVLFLAALYFGFGGMKGDVLS